MRWYHGWGMPRYNIPCQGNLAIFWYSVIPGRQWIVFGTIGGPFRLQPKRPGYVCLGCRKEYLENAGVCGSCNLQPVALSTWFAFSRSFCYRTGSMIFGLYNAKVPFGETKPTMVNGCTYYSNLTPRPP